MEVRSASVSIQKWLTFSVALTTATVISDALVVFLGEGPFTVAQIFSKGELFVASIGMLVSASGELLFDRIRLGGSPTWYLSASSMSFIAAIPMSGAYGFAKSGLISGSHVMSASCVCAAVSFLWGLLVVALAGRK